MVLESYSMLLVEDLNVQSLIPMILLQAHQANLQRWLMEELDIFNRCVTFKVTQLRAIIYLGRL